MESEATRDWYMDQLPDDVATVISDPPWSPSYAKLWRKMAEVSPAVTYSNLMRCWTQIASMCIQRGAEVLIERSTEVKNNVAFFEAVAERPTWSLSLLEKWSVFYGSPGSGGVRTPNDLLHFGSRHLTTDPTGLTGEPMFIRTCAGLGLRTGSVLVDPCIGKGMTSRMAHYFDANCIGSELNQKRVDAALAWLKFQGYTIEEIAS